MEIPRLLFHISLGYFPAQMVLRSDGALIIGNEASVLSFPLHHTITYEVTTPCTLVLFILKNWFEHEVDLKGPVPPRFAEKFHIPPWS